MQHIPSIAAATVVVRNSRPSADRGEDRSGVPEDGQRERIDLFARQVWQLADRPRSVAEICVDLRREMEMQPEDCLRRVCDSIERMARTDRLVIVEPCTDPVHPEH
jgi:Coenzyme PQQ synthesis protein D (PqqD)